MHCHYRRSNRSERDGYVIDAVCYLERYYMYVRLPANPMIEDGKNSKAQKKGIK